MKILKSYNSIDRITITTIKRSRWSYLQEMVRTAMNYDKVILFDEGRDRNKKNLCCTKNFIKKL